MDAQRAPSSAAPPRGLPDPDQATEMLNNLAEGRLTGFAGLAGTRAWALTVSGITDLTPQTRQIHFTKPELDGFEYLPGQDLMFIFPKADKRTVARRYTIRRFDRATRTLDVDFVLHGDGVAVNWAPAAQPGARLKAVGPRGSITFDPNAAWHFFAGDETALPGILHMIEAIPPATAAIAVVEVDVPQEEQPLPFPNTGTRQFTWLHRATPARGANSPLIDAVTSAALPQGAGRFYLAGEVSLVAAMQRALLARGIPPEQISPKGYWSLGRANIFIGEPEKRP